MSRPRKKNHAQHNRRNAAAWGSIRDARFVTDAQIGLSASRPSRQARSRDVDRKIWRMPREPLGPADHLLAGDRQVMRTQCRGNRQTAVLAPMRSGAGRRLHSQAFQERRRARRRAIGARSHDSSRRFAKRWPCRHPEKSRKTGARLSCPRLSPRATRRSPSRIGARGLPAERPTPVEFRLLMETDHLRGQSEEQALRISHQSSCNRSKGGRLHVDNCEARFPAAIGWADPKFRPAAGQSSNPDAISVGGRRHDDVPPMFAAEPEPQNRADRRLDCVDPIGDLDETTAPSAKTPVHEQQPWLVAFCEQAAVA
jgi:hypothetical protein